MTPSQAAMTAGRLLILVPLLGACATAPTGPTVMVLPGGGTSFDQFQADDATCRDWAARRAGGPGQQWEYNMAYQQCMYAKSHVIPGAHPPYRGSSPVVPPPPPR
jgi:hypothetical protein